MSLCLFICLLLLYRLSAVSKIREQSFVACICFSSTAKLYLSTDTLVSLVEVKAMFHLNISNDFFFLLSFMSFLGLQLLTGQKCLQTYSAWSHLGSRSLCRLTLTSGISTHQWPILSLLPLGIFEVHKQAFDMKCHMKRTALCTHLSTGCHSEIAVKITKTDK